MDERERMFAILRDLALPQGRYIVNGSGSLIAHGLTAEDRGKPMGDLDIFVATRDWFALYGPPWTLWTTDPDDPARRSDPPYLTRIMRGLRVDVFHGWRRRAVGNFDVAFYLANPVIIEGFPFAPLPFILDWKREVGRAKDVDDVRLLEGYLGTVSQ